MLPAAEDPGARIAARDQQGNWMSYGHAYDEQRYVIEDGINTANVERLGLAWYLDLPDMRSLVSTPLVIDGTLYFSGSYAVVTAVDAASGKVLWRYDPETLKHAGENRKLLWDFSRGLAWWNGKIFVAGGNGRLHALDATTGIPAWIVPTLDPATPRTITGAPRAFNDLVIIGHGGADFGPVRGYVTAYDAETGEQRWRFHTVPGNPADGFENRAMAMAAQTWTGEWWRHGGGGTVWNAITYDPEFNRIYLGTGNGAPWNRKIRSPGGGDNLFLCSIVALDADSGEYLWHYQTTPGETWDFNSAMDIVLADLNIDGHERKVILHAPKNGFFYVIDRGDGSLISAEKIGKVTWASRVDMETGRPVETPAARYPDGEAEIWPGPFGAHSWHPMSFNPATGLVYLPYQEASGYYNDRGFVSAGWEHAPFAASGSGVHGLEYDIPTAGTWSALTAWDPVRQEKIWQVKTPGLWNPGTLTTAGGLVFQGDAEGIFTAYDAADGAVLWRFDTGLGISAPPISYRIGDRQYIALLVGWGGVATALGGSIAGQHGWDFNRNKRRLLVFALDGSEKLPATERPAPTVMAGPLAPGEFDQRSVAAGRNLYAEHCAICHGSGAVGGGFAPDLRRSPVALDENALAATITKGRLSLGMPAFDQFDQRDLAALHQFLLSKAYRQGN